MRARPQHLLDYTRHWWLRTVVIATLLFLYAPIVLMIAFSFNDSRRNIVWRGFTTKYYTKAFHNESLIEAFTNTLVIATACMILSTILAVMAAIVLWRFRFPLRPIAEGTIALPIVVPEICFGVALLVFFAAINWPTTLPWPLSLSNIVIAHTAFAFPFATIIIRSRLSGFDRALAESSRDLGASEWQTTRYILLPFLKPGIIAGALISFTLSLDDFIITFFTAGPSTITLPVKVFSMVRFSVTPEVNAASTILIIITLITAISAAVMQRGWHGRTRRSPS